MVLNQIELNGVTYDLETLGGALPVVSSSDAGKFLKVNDSGDWAAIAVPNAEEASF